MKRKIGLVILGWVLIFSPVLAGNRIVAQPIEKNDYVLEISKQEGGGSEVKISREKFCLIVCFVKELIPNLAHIQRSLRDLFKDDSEQSNLGASILATTPEPVKKIGASLREFSIEFSNGIKELAKEPKRLPEGRALPIITVSIYQP